MKPLALALLLACLTPGVAFADEPTLEALMTRLGALGLPREGETERYAQLERAIAEAQSAEEADETARATRHRALAEALMRGIESNRQAALVRTQLNARRQALAQAQARLDAARARESQSNADQARSERGMR